MAEVRAFPKITANWIPVLEDKFSLTRYLCILAQRLVRFALDRLKSNAPAKGEQYTDNLSIKMVI